MLYIPHNNRLCRLGRHCHRSRWAYRGVLLVLRLLNSRLDTLHSLVALRLVSMRFQDTTLVIIPNMHQDQEPRLHSPRSGRSTNIAHDSRRRRFIFITGCLQGKHLHPHRGGRARKNRQCTHIPTRTVDQNIKVPRVERGNPKDLTNQLHCPLLFHDKARQLVVGDLVVRTIVASRVIFQ